MNVNIKIENLREIKEAFRIAPQEMAHNLNIAVKKAGILFHARAEQLSPKKTGFLARTHQLRLAPYKAEITPTAKYAYFVHEGTKPHMIRVRNAKILTDGKNFFGKSVFHPGVKAKQWLRWTRDNTNLEIQGFFKQAVKDTLKNTARRIS